MSNLAKRGSTFVTSLPLRAVVLGIVAGVSACGGAGPTDSDTSHVPTVPTSPARTTDAGSVVRAKDDAGSDALSKGDEDASSESAADAQASAPDAQGSQADAQGALDAGAKTDAHETDAHETDAHETDAHETDAVPPGTVTIENLDHYMFEIANGGADHCTTANGHNYCGGSCNGTCAGSSALSTYSIETGVSTPALTGTSSKVDVTGATSDTLEWVKLDPAAKGTGAYSNDTHFTWDFYFYPTETDHVQAYEFDAFYGSNGWWLMMGSQCDLTSGNWNGWNEATGHWTTSSVENCGSFFTLNEWNHIVIHYHRDPGEVSGATQYYYDSLEVNGVSHAWGLPGYLGKENGWDDVVGAQVQQDLEASFTGTLSSFYDSFTFQISP